MPRVTMIVDLQFGSTGKGLIAGYLAEREAPDTVINANMPNAGHTYVDAKGRKFMHKVLPNGVVSPNLKRCMIGPQSVFSLEQLRKEAEECKDLLSYGGPKFRVYNKLIIHPDAVVLQDSHRELEQANLSKISSTMQGSMAAIIDKMMRDPNRDFRAVTVLKGTEFEYNVATHDQWRKHLMEAEHILAEGAQGYSLGINAGFWPYCTSRDCTPARFMADMGLPHSWLTRVVGTARVHPIRVGNTPDGYSGDVYPDQIETTFEALNQKTELTTVTKRPRRIFTFSFEQMKQAIFACQPNEIFLNFCNYDGAEAYRVRKQIESIANHRIVRSNKHGPKIVRYLGWGPSFNDVEDISE